MTPSFNTSSITSGDNMNAYIMKHVYTSSTSSAPIQCSWCNMVPTLNSPCWLVVTTCTIVIFDLWPRHQSSLHVAHLPVFESKIFNLLPPHSLQIFTVFQLLVVVYAGICHVVMDHTPPNLTKCWHRTKLKFKHKQLFTSLTSKATCFAAKQFCSVQKNSSFHLSLVQVITAVDIWRCFCFSTSSAPCNMQYYWWRNSQHCTHT